jgi:hypothetical protein
MSKKNVRRLILYSFLTGFLAHKALNYAHDWYFWKAAYGVCSADKRLKSYESLIKCIDAELGLFFYAKYALLRPSASTDILETEKWIY